MKCVHNLKTVMVNKCVLNPNDCKRLHYHTVLIRYRTDTILLDYLSSNLDFVVFLLMSFVVA